MITLRDLPIEKLPLSKLPFYHRHDVHNPLKCKSFIRLGDVKRGGNEPYCFTEEKQCAGRVCRVLAPKDYQEDLLVIRDDGTVWKIWLGAFTEAARLEIVPD